MSKAKMKELGAATEPALDESFDRVVLKSQERARVESWLSQLEQQYQGLIRFSKSDLINFLVRRHETVLTDAELQQLGAEFYDEMRWITRAIERVRQSKRGGVALDLEDLMAMRKPIEKLRARLAKKLKQPSAKSANDESLIDDQAENSELKTSESIS